MVVDKAGTRLRASGYRSKDPAKRREFAPLSWWAPVDVIAAVDAHAERADMSRSAIMRKAVRLAIEEDHLKPDTDPEQISFELLGIVLVTHNHRRLLGDKEARKRALTAFDELIARHSTSRK